MTYVIAAPCVSDYSCVEVCPVDCIEPTPSSAAFDTAEQLYIDPQRCINCGSCVGVCPVGAIFSEGDLPERWQRYADVNRDHFEVSP
jgi:NAD-dependent dihydropyrimidine dehydrogenase PreA subunit